MCARARAKQPPHVRFHRSKRGPRQPVGLLRRYLDKCYMRSRSNQSGPQGWLCAERFLRIFSIEIKTINQTPSTSFTRRPGWALCQKRVRASCSRLMCLPIDPSVSAAPLLAILLDPQSMAARFFAAHLAARQTLAWTGAPQLFAGRSANKHAVCCFETHAFAHRTFGGSIRCSFRGRASNRPALKPVPVPSALT